MSIESTAEVIESYKSEIVRMETKLAAAEAQVAQLEKELKTARAVPRALQCTWARQAEAAEAEVKALREDKESLIELLNEAIRSIVPLAHTTHLHYPPECTACKYDKKVRQAIDSARSQNK